jgi:hypothetical protein
VTNEWGFEDAIVMAGGRVTVETCPEVIPRDQLLENIATIQRVSDHFHSILKRTGVEGGGLMDLTLSPSFSCSVRQVREGEAILVPLGAVARIRATARLLLRHWEVKKVPRFVRSPVDRIDDDPETIPPLLRPIFLETLTPEEFWKGLLKLDRSIDLDPRFEPDVRELVHLALVYFLSHEFTHALHGHFKLLTEARAGIRKTDTARLLRGMEIDADDGAAAITMLIVGEDITQTTSAGEEHTRGIVRAWLRLGYAVTMLFGIMDVLHKHFPGYEEGSYNHPMVRCELFFSAAEDALKEPEDKELWRNVSRQGWSGCVCALEMLNSDAFSGLFGRVPTGKFPALLHSMLYAAPATTPGALAHQLREARDLLGEVRKLLPIFQPHESC